MTYQLTDFAINDIKKNTQFTLDTWGADAVESYITSLLDKLDAIGRDEVVKEEYSDEYPNFFVTKFRYHKIFN